jgi:predicted RNase H-like HicB family nuclease
VIVNALESFTKKMREAFNSPSICNLMRKTLTVIVKRDEEGWYVGSVPELLGCHTQAKTLDGLMERIKEAIELYLEVEPDILQKEESQFVGTHHVEVSYDETKAAAL